MVQEKIQQIKLHTTNNFCCILHTNKKEKKIKKLSLQTPTEQSSFITNIPSKSELKKLLEFYKVLENIKEPINSNA